MPKATFLIVVVAVLVLGALYFLSTLPSEKPTHSIEVSVPQGNAH